MIVQVGFFTSLVCCPSLCCITSHQTCRKGVYVTYPSCGRQCVGGHRKCRSMSLRLLDFCQTTNPNVWFEDVQNEGPCLSFCAHDMGLLRNFVQTRVPCVRLRSFPSLSLKVTILSQNFAHGTLMFAFVWNLFNTLRRPLSGVHVWNKGGSVTDMCIATALFVLLSCVDWQFKSQV